MHGCACSRRFCGSTPDSGRLILNTHVWYKQNDTQMVSILYRTHKGLSPSAKVWSLYAFDALARAARNRANKSNMTGNLSSEKGNCATFLLKIEGILDGLFQDLILSGSDELKVSPHSQPLTCCTCLHRRPQLDMRQYR